MNFFETFSRNLSCFWVYELFSQGFLLKNLQIKTSFNLEKNILNYKGFIGLVSFAAKDEVFYGKDEGIKDLITFEGDSVQELKDAFQ